MNNQPGLGFIGLDCFKYLVKWDHHVIQFLGWFAQPELQGEERAGHGAGHGDFSIGEFGAAHHFAGDNHGAVAIAHAGPAGQQRVLPAHVGVGMDADGGDVQLALRGPLVKRLNILQDVFELKAVSWNQLFGQPVKHECVVRIW